MDRTVRVTKLMMPGEAQVYRAFLETKEVVDRIASEHLGFKPDDGYRPMTARERIAEFDALTPEQRRAIIDKMSMQWYINQAAEVDTLREALAGVPTMPAEQPPAAGA